MKKKANELMEYGGRILRTLILMFESSRIMFLLLIVFSFITGISTPINIYIWKVFLDYTTILLTGDTSVIFYMAVFLGLHFLVTIMYSLTQQIANYLQSIFGTYVDKNITDKILTKIQQLDLKDFDKSKTYNTMQKASNESFQRSMSILRTLIQVVKNTSSVLGLFGMLFTFSKSCILICVFSTIPIFYINNKMLNKWFDVFNERFEKLRFASYLKSLCIKNENIKELKIFNVSPFMKKNILNIYERNIKEDKVIRKSFLLENSLIDFVDKVFTYLMKGIVVYLGFITKMTIGSMVTYIETIDSLKNSLNNIMSMISQTYEDSLYMKSLFELLDMKIENDKKISFNRDFKKIEFINVSFRYPETKRDVIKNFNYVFESNKTYALVGLNGSGKTTLIKLILNLYEATSGEILIDGININRIDKASLYKYSSAIFQDFIKYPFDIRTNITLGNKNIEGKQELIDKVTEFSGAKEFIDKLPDKYNTRLQKEWTSSVDLSLGQWQKLAVSRAAIKESSILVLDEPTASIDAVTEFEMFNNFRELKNNKLCILVTHRFSSIKIVDEILVLENGILKEFGSHNELIEKNGEYKRLYSMQADSYKLDTAIIN